MVAARDLKCGNDVAKMAALGRWADEFSVYGVSYWENEKVWHYISANQEEIWRFVEESQKEARYPTMVAEWVNRTLVPSGERENYLWRTKVIMAQKMKAWYSENFLAGLVHFAQRENSSTADKWLWQWQDELIGCFEREKLERFRTLVQYAYDSKKLSLAAYTKLQGWLEHVFNQMADDPVVRKAFKRTFFGIGYGAWDKRQYYVNAKKALVWQKKQQLMSQGISTTPIWQKTYWYDYQPNLAETKKDFLAHIQACFDKTYDERLHILQKLSGPIEAADYAAWLHTLADAPEVQRTTATYYKTCWHL